MKLNTVPAVVLPCSLKNDAAELRRDEADELEHEVWVAVMQSLPNYRPDGKPRSFRRWLNTIVRRRAVDLFRQENRHPAKSLTWRFDNEPFDPSPEPADAFDRFWISHEIMSVLDILRETIPHTRLFEQHYLEGRSIVQIAAEQQRTPAQVRVTIHRVMNQLRKALHYFLGE